MADLDAIAGWVRGSVDAWLRACCWCDTTAFDRGEAGRQHNLTPLEDLAAHWEAWAREMSPARALGLTWETGLRMLARAAIEMRATRADCVYDDEQCRSVHRVNIVVRGAVEDGRRDAAPTDTSEALMAAARGCG